MSQIKKRPNQDQGPWSAWATKKAGSHRDPQKEAKVQGPSGSKNDPYKPGTKANGSHLDPGPNLPGSDKTAQRGGGGVKGADRINPKAGKSKSGSKNAQHPNVDKKNGGASGSYLK